MRNEAKAYFLREYGSWTVLIVSSVLGLVVSRSFTWLALPLFVALCLLINSKQAFTKWSRQKNDSPSLAVFLGQLSAAALIFIGVFGSDIFRLLPLLVFPAAYLVSNRAAGEHFVLTELLGFTLISLAAVLQKFLVTGGLDVRLFVAVALYFMAGVFKVKALVRKRPVDRILAVIYVAFALFIYRGFHLSLFILAPLIDNVVAAVTLYKVKLQTTGWIEVCKSLLFLALMIVFF